MNKLILLIGFFTLTAQAKSIKDYPFYQYDLAFTNPECEEYFYEDVMLSNGGDYLRSKPKNAYCKGSDKEKNENRPESPNYKIKELLKDTDVNEVFLTYLSFSNSDVAQEVCKAIERGVKVTLIIDSKNENRESGRRQFDYISKCKPENDNIGEVPLTMFRGNKGGLGYAHNKIIMASYKSEPKKTTIVFSSGNMSSGTTLHHENWHFLTTSKDSYFYQVHQCVKDGMINEESSSRKSKFKKFLSECRSKISAPEETDIKTYFVPSDGKEAMNNLVNNIEKAENVEVAVHRFTHNDFINALVAKKTKVKLIVDDDIHWTGVLNQSVGSNLIYEYNNVRKVIRSGAQVKYVESNQNQWLLHHNKFVIFYFKDGSKAVHTGAGNFTKAAFTKNFENYYFITIPEVTDKFEQQYKHLFNKLASWKNEISKDYILP